MPALIVIPARRASTRLPDKLLLRETGKPVLQHTVERALEAAARVASSGTPPTTLVWTACDDAELAQAAAGAGIKAVMVAEYCESGTERICRALPSLPPGEVIVNWQADEPEMPADWVVDCVTAFTSTPAPDVVTVAVPIAVTDPILDDPNVVKVVLDHNGFALYFSRATIPHVRKGGKVPEPRALRHVGLYAYSRAFLDHYDQMPLSSLELSECLEQLRFLQAGVRIKVLVKPMPATGFRGIDTLDDYREFVARQKRK